MSRPTPHPLFAESDSPPEHLGGEIISQLGGIEGLVISTLPILVLIPVNAQFGLVPAVSAAVATAVISGIYLLIRGRGVQPAISGIIGAAIGAAIALGVGSASGYFLYGIVVSAVFSAALVLSALLRRPLVAYAYDFFSSPQRSTAGAWKTDARLRRPLTLATWVWALIAAARVLVQGALYRSDAVAALGVTKIAMGWPLTILAALVTWWAVRQVHRYRDATTAEPTTPTA